MIALDSLKVNDINVETFKGRRTAMRTSRAFALGAIMGAAVVWLWGREMEEYVEEKTRRVRTKTMKVLDRGGDAVHRIDDFLQDTKEHVSEALQAAKKS